MAAVAQVLLPRASTNNPLLAAAIVPWTLLIAAVSGGFIVINQTEALVAIDVNTGKFVGHTNLEETVLQNNLEAAEEVVLDAAAADDGWIPLFDGKSLDGWTQKNGTATYRVEDGTIVGKGFTAPGYEEPIVFWVPAIAISGLSVYNGDRFPQWKGNIFVGGMRNNTGQHIQRVWFNAKGDPIGINFTIPRKFRVRLEITCDDATGIFKLETRNLERFGIMKFELVPESLNQELLDQIALMIIGERHNVGKLIKRLSQLIASWDKDGEGSDVETDDDGGTPSQLFADSGFMDAGSFGDANCIDVHPTVEAGPYEITPIEATGEDAVPALNGWLHDHGFVQGRRQRMGKYDEDEHARTVCFAKDAAPHGRCGLRVRRDRNFIAGNRAASACRHPL